MLGGRTAGSVGLAINQHINMTVHQVTLMSGRGVPLYAKMRTVSTVCPSMLRRNFRSVNDLVLYSTKMSESITLHN